MIRTAWRGALLVLFIVLVPDGGFGARLHAADDAGSAAKGISLRWLPKVSESTKGVVEVIGLDPRFSRALAALNWQLKKWQALLSVYVEQRSAKTGSDLPAMVGVYRLSGNVISFEPAFALEHGMIYRVLFRPDHLPGWSGGTPEPITTVFTAPSPPFHALTTISQVYPSSEELPENLLKFYIHFSAPMSRGHIYDHLHLRTEKGKDVELPFLELEEELWNPAMTRLTLFIDPGRIKRGVRPLEEIGPAIEAGKRYILLIDREWEDANGHPLQEGFQKSFHVTAADRKPLNPATWELRPPKSQTRDRLQVVFPKSMDHALAQRVIEVTLESGQAVEGEVAMEDQERHWMFLPAQPWRQGAYQIVVQTTLEDLAGNNIGKAFEVDLFDDVQGRLTNSAVKLSFETQ